MNKDIKSVFRNVGLPEGRMIDASKSFYWEKFPNNITYFDITIITLSQGRVWWGDLDITFDGSKLEQVAKELKEDLYVLRTNDVYRENENKPNEELIKAAIWSTEINK